MTQSIEVKSVTFRYSVGGWQIRPRASVSRPECVLGRPARQARRGQSPHQGASFRSPTASASGGDGRGHDVRAGEGRADGKSVRERLFFGSNAASGDPTARPAAAKVPFRGRRFVARRLQPRAVAGAAGRAGAGMMGGRAWGWRMANPLGSVCFSARMRPRAARPPGPPRPKSPSAGEGVT